VQAFTVSILHGMVLTLGVRIILSGFLFAFVNNFKLSYCYQSPIKSAKKGISSTIPFSKQPGISPYRRAYVHSFLCLLERERLNHTLDALVLSKFNGLFTVQSVTRWPSVHRNTLHDHWDCRYRDVANSYGKLVTIMPTR
jgi:hypothetical protein